MLSEHTSATLNPQDELAALRRVVADLQNVEAQRQRLEDLISHVPGVVWEAWGQPNVASQRIDFVSPYIEPLVGYSQDEWLQTPNFWLTIVHPEDKERAGRETGALFARKGTGVVQFRWLHKDGQVLWVESHSTVLEDANGQPVGMRGVTMDISARKNAEFEQQRLQEDVVRIQAAALEQLSTPLIPINDHVMVMPLIGSMDSRRAQNVLEVLLEGIAQHRAKVVILDITGVPVVDTQVANALIRAAQATELLGAQVILTGIRPEVAQTLVGLGTDLRTITTQATLQSGIAYAMRQQER